MYFPNTGTFCVAQSGILMSRAKKPMRKNTVLTCSHCLRDAQKSTSTSRETASYMGTAESQYRSSRLEVNPVKFLEVGNLSEQNLYPETTDKSPNMFAF